MRITWYGHAAFLIEAEGTRIILDPYRSPDSGGYEPIDDTADLVVVSHENDKYHSHLGQISRTASGSWPSRFSNRRKSYWAMR